MKTFYRLNSIIFIVVSICFFGSCKNQNESEGGYSVYKNFDKFPNKGIKALQDGEEIVGVLLKYTSEGAYNSDVFPMDSNTFSIYCLFNNHGFSGDGMEFNYVLYVPEDIQKQFITGGGKNPNSGDPFWWYMKTYLNSTMQVIQNDWVSTISILCNQSNCPKADSSDVISPWK